MGTYRPSIKLQDRHRSNMQNHEMPKKVSIEKGWCSVHPIGYLGKDQFNNWYSQCYTGKKCNEQCKIIIEGGENNE